MNREKKVFLCVKSLINISVDIVEVYKDYSDILLFIADKIAEKEQKRNKENEKPYTVHGKGQIHDLSSKDIKCDESECDFVLEEEDDKIEKEIDDMILTVKKEMDSVSD